MSKSKYREIGPPKALIPLSHFHTRRRIADNDLDPDEGNRRLCRACTLPIFSTPYVIQKIHFDDDDNDDDDGDDGDGDDDDDDDDNDDHDDDEDDDTHFLHKSCANLPQEFKEHPLHVSGPLILRKTRNLPSFCSNCYRKFDAGFFYVCPDDDCRFRMDVLCAVTVRIVHRCHEHELTLIRNRNTSNSFTCGGCGLVRDVRGKMYVCDVCGFYIHKKCASLPNTILHREHPHPLCLTFAVPIKSLRFQKCQACSICNEQYSESSGGVYFCTICNYTVHIKCAVSDSSAFRPMSSQDAVSGLIHFPMPDEHTSFLSRVLNIGIAGEHKIHHHDMVLHDKTNGDDEDEASCNLCNVCVRPISPPFYTCPHCPHFYLHRYCANLPFKSQLHPQHPRHPQDPWLDERCNTTHQPLHLTPFKLSTGFFSASQQCQGCDRYCNEFVYKGEKECEYMLDAECGHLPEAITHEMHGKSHILFLSSDISFYFSQCHCCSRYLGTKLYYECCSCPNFKLDARCAILPSTISHKLDRHRLTLSSLEHFSPRDADVDFCEICEKGMDKESWFYHCKECTTFFHIDCIPCVGWLSKIKFGETMSVKCHKCPLTSIRTLTSHTCTCDRCKKTIKGRQESFWPSMKGIAFECVQCRYWLCYDCAEEECIREEESSSI